MDASPPTTKPILPDNPPPSTEPSILASASSNDTATSEIQKCLSLLDEGKSKVKTNQTDIVFLLGMTGSGKTTLVKFLATNNDHLRAEEVAENIGEFVINDADEKISSSTVLSQTIFPELYLDPETQIPFFDGPGFSDTRGLAVDIAGAYFVHQVITESKKIRFILAINYSSVRHGMDRGDFLEALKHVLQLVKNIDPYLNSIALVVTKVENHMVKKGREMVLVSDKVILETVAKFLLDFKSNIPKVAHGAVAENMGKLVDVFLRKTDSTYEKIALFRRPEEAGPISKIQTLQEAKSAIKKIVRENLQPANVNKEDFGITISEESKNKLHDVIAIIDENIASAIKEKCKSKILIYESKTATSNDIFKVHETFRSDFETLRNWLDNKLEDTNLQSFLDNLPVMSKNMAADFSDKEVSEIVQQGEYIAFLETINGKKFKGSVSSWKIGFQPYLTYLKENTIWYKFLSAWYTVLSSYPVQKKQNDFAHLLEHRVTNLYDEQFVKLWSFCKSLTSELDGFQSVLMDSYKTDQFNKILDMTLRSDVNVSYNKESKTLVVRGKFIKFSEHINTHKNLPTAHFITVFATDKLFIDVNFNKHDNLQTLFLAAPTWEVVGAVHIKLDGEKGCCKALERAPDGNEYSKGGRNGKPGAPGKSAANIIGLVNTVINGEHLKISANGGEGGPGQDGGNGDDGNDGDSPITKYSWGCAGGNYDDFAYEKLGGFFRGVYCVYGQRGGNGGNGGHGGVGGYGGHPGKIIIPLKQRWNITSEAREGASGTAGLGGEGGQGGKAGRSWNHQTLLGEWRDASCSRSERLANEYGDCADTDYRRNGLSGDYGESGVNSLGIQEAGYTVLVDLDATINEYKEFLQRESKNDTINRLSKIEFLKKLDNLPKTKILPHLVSKRMADLAGKRFKRHGPLINDSPKWIGNNGFQGSQWPIIEKIGNAQATTDLTLPSVPAINDLLLLTDLLIRKLNQTRPNYFQSCITDDVSIRGCALHILSIFEKTKASIHGVEEVEHINEDIDPVVLMEKLEKEIRNGSPQTITKILLDSLDNETSEYKEKFRHQLAAELELGNV